MTKRILVAYDGSDLSREAVYEARNQACETPKREIHIVSVINPTGPVTNAVVSRSIGNEMAEKLRSEMDVLKEQMASSDVDVITEVLVSKVEGNPGISICKYADEQAVDLIIVGNRGLGKVKKMFLGSVSNNVVQHANCPVLVMK
ncbi:Nucleotide-binding universal stress protein, UspA family [Halobacillus dabanensis]|uniref:Nucleotide-binding universal stress protein, UspA family n=1 Tax=Halobacillus dabanensis TaxID=240302 RepID=A0A1I3WNJ6_HALDA|nr:universal stress protein [Halobacillus dabanensis]SFK08447.1 Nucleotide-binding universal stress protein, UspA family [Halobacillus dabanensis]